jgi:hypothetical protein
MTQTPKRRCVELDISKKSAVYDFKLIVEDGEIFIDLRTLAKYSEWARLILEETDSKQLEIIQNERRPGSKSTWFAIMQQCETDFRLLYPQCKRGELIYIMDYLRFEKYLIDDIVKGIITSESTLVYAITADEKWELTPYQYAIPFVNAAYTISDLDRVIFNDSILLIISACNWKALVLDALVRDMRNRPHQDLYRFGEPQHPRRGFGEPAPYNGGFVFGAPAPVAQ